MAMVRQATRRQATEQVKGRTAIAPRATACEVQAVAFETELGWMAVAHADAVLRATVLKGIVFGHTSRMNAVKALERYLKNGDARLASADWSEVDDQPAAIADLVDRFTRFAAGDEVDFADVVVDESHLTTFGRRIVRACRKIPIGETRGYGELAKLGGSPGAARAVGQVMARNRYPLVVPCHRVLAAGGRIGGFSAPQGLAMKRRLLELERRELFD
jgi:methylated-DNA-[protein]-cysteine S-methyltransferase